MDIDQEVVREPFEDADSIGSVDQSPDLVTVTTTGRNSCADFSQISNIANESLSRGGDNQSDLVDQLYLENHGDEADSPINPEDVRFADSFGIKLEVSDNIRIYEKLMNSNHVLDKPRKKRSATLETSITSDCIYHRGTFYQKGDIVAMFDQDDGLIYFAQLSGFLQDQYCEKSASIFWLVPIRPTSRDFFDPSAYRIGLEDTQLRKLDCMTFVRHCPHDYYLKKFFQLNQTSNISSTDTSQPSNQSDPRSKREQNYIWTTMRPCKVPTL